MTDPFESLARPAEPREPRAAFARRLRARLVAELGLLHASPVNLPERRAVMTTTPTTTPAGAASPADAAVAVTPYLTASDATAALAWYKDALGAVERLRIPMGDGRIGHAEFTIGAARFMLSDENPELGVRSPASLGGTSVSLHLSVPDVDDRYGRAVAAGATELAPPADQPHGARHGTLVDPFGHRWLLSQPLSGADADAELPGTRPGEQITVAHRPGTGGGIWAGVYYTDALAGIRFLVDVVGFEEQLVVTGADGRTVVHSQLRWPEGGVVQVGTHDPANDFSHLPGEQALYVVTADPRAVWERCLAAGVEVVRELATPDHDPGGLAFVVRDPERNLWSFGTYGLSAG